MPTHSVVDSSRVGTTTGRSQTSFVSALIAKATTSSVDGIKDIVQKNPPAIMTVVVTATYMRSLASGLVDRIIKLEELEYGAPAEELDAGDGVQVEDYSEDD